MKAFLPGLGLNWEPGLWLGELRSSKMLKDRLSLLLLLSAAGINGLNLLLLALRLTAGRGYIPTHYSSLAGFEGLGPWYGPFMIALFGLGVTLLNLALALVIFGRSRLVSFYLLATAVATGIFCLVVSNAFATVSQ